MLFNLNVSCHALYPIIMDEIAKKLYIFIFLIFFKKSYSLHCISKVTPSVVIGGIEFRAFSTKGTSLLSKAA